MSSTSVRLPAAERRAAILEVARELFGRQGYHGTTTDQIASAAGISQPYVVRMFGSKEKLFLEVLDDTMATLMATWRAKLASMPADADWKARKMAVGDVYLELARTRGLHTLLLQAFVSGAEPAIGAAARAGFLQIYRFLVDEVELSAEHIHEFLASGMLYSIMLGIGMTDLYDQDADAAALLQVTFGDMCLAVVQASRPEPSPRP